VSTDIQQEHQHYEAAHEGTPARGLLDVRVRPAGGDEGVDVPPSAWPSRPSSFGELLTPVEAAQYLRLDETGAHTPASAVRTLDFWRGKAQLRATKFARRVWYRRAELDRFLERKTET
jgi:hypothetical protein